MAINIEVLTIYPYLVGKIRLILILSKIQGPKTLHSNENLYNIDKTSEKTPQYLHYGSIFSKKVDKIF